MDLAEELDAPRLGVLGRRVAELRERDPKLGRPALGVGRDGRLPHGVPRAVLADIVVEQEVALDPRRTHLELEGRPVVVVRVEDDGGVVARHAHVAATERGRDPPGVVHPHPDVDRAAIVEHARFGPLGRRLAGLRPVLDKVGGDLRVGP